MNRTQSKNFSLFFLGMGDTRESSGDSKESRELRDYSIVVSDNRKVLINGLKAKGILVSQRQGTNWLKTRLQNVLMKEHPIHELVEGLNKDQVILDLIKKIKKLMASIVFQTSLPCS